MYTQYYTKLTSIPMRPLSDVEARIHAQDASIADSLERAWGRSFELYFRELDYRVFKELADRGRILDGKFIDFEPLVLELSIDVLKSGIASARGYARLAKVPAGPRLPQSFQALREMWDEWRKRKRIPPRQRVVAENLRKAYLARCQKIWKEHSEEFRNGGVFNQLTVGEIIKRKGDMARSRADTIVRTETTYYYNRGRASVYDAMEDVGGYLFVAIRDQATTKWCRTRQGLVYLKSDLLAVKERPPIHWRCRSEMLPLLWKNPRHRALLESDARNRRSHQCEPLPSGWGQR